MIQYLCSFRRHGIGKIWVEGEMGRL
jgi:hypothetical protein